MRVYLFLILFLIGLGLTIKKPFYGILLFVVLFYAAPPYHWWGRIIHDQLHIRTSLLCSLVLLISYIIHKRSLAEANQDIDNGPLICLLILMFFMFLATPWAVVSVERAKAENIEFFKRILFYFLMTRIINTDKELRDFIWLNLLGCFYFGWEAFGGGYTSGGRLEMIGGPGTREAEGLAAHLCIFLPYLGLYFLNGSKWEKIVVTIISPFILNALIMTKTRASFLSLFPMALYFIIFCDKKYRKKAIVFLPIGIAAFLYLTEPGYWTRMGTITTDKEEVSENPRMVIWRGAIKMMFDYPMGVGGANFNLLSGRYLPRARSCHNSFLEVGAEYGWFALLAFVSLWGSILKIFRRNRRYETLNEKDRRRKVDIFGMEIGLIGFFVASCFVNRVLTDSFYWMAAIAVIGDKLWKINQHPINSCHSEDNLTQ